MIYIRIRGGGGDVETLFGRIPFEQHLFSVGASLRYMVSYLGFAK